MNINVICNYKKLLLALNLERQYAGRLFLYLYSVNTHDKKTSTKKSEVFVWQTFDIV